jgi:hypothetical protein
MITCNTCKETKDPAEFNKDKTNKTTGRQRHCRDCQKKRWAERTPEQERWRRIKTKYNLTQGEWEDIFESQGRRCAICGTTEPNSSYNWHTDHNHDTGKVRGILCCNCNRAIGFLNNPSHLRSAAEYLKKQ